MDVTFRRTRGLGDVRAERRGPTVPESPAGMRVLARGSLLAPRCVQRAPAPRCGARRVHPVAEFDELLAQGVPLSDLDVRGDTAMPDGRSFADHEVGK